MKTLSICILVCLFASNVIAQSRVEIRNLLRQIEGELRYTDASERELRQVTQNLRRSLRILETGNGGGTPPTNGECVEFAYEKYYISLSSAAAMDKANQACRQIRDLAVAKTIYEYAYISYSSKNAMDLAANLATTRNIGKDEIVRFAASKYYISLSGANSAKLAGQNSMNVSRRSLPCLQRNYEAYYRSYSASQAMDRAFSNCRN